MAKKRMSGWAGRVGLGVAFVLAASGASNCGSKAKLDTDTDDAAEEAVNSAGGVTDDADGSVLRLAASEASLAARAAVGDAEAVPSIHERRQISATNRCYAKRPGRQACVNGVRSTTYEACVIGGDATKTMSGTAKLTYSDSACKMAAVGNSVTRTVSLTRTLPAGTHTASSDTHTDWEGLSLGGGATLTVLEVTGGSPSKWAIDVAGMHKVIKDSAGTSKMDHSVRTSSSITVTGSGVGRGSKTFNGGPLIVSHNLKKFTAKTTFENVKWGDDDCCYPTEGKATIDLSGSKSTTFTVEYSSTCGSATATSASGTSRALTLSLCEND